MENNREEFSTQENPSGNEVNFVLYPEDKKEEKKEKKKASNWKLITLCVLLSAVVGFSSGLLAIKLFGIQNTVIYQSQPSSEVIEVNNDALNSVSYVAANVADSVVEIRTEQMVTSTWLQQYVSEGAGSGVVFSKDGTIITNNHVIDGATNITVTMHDGTTYPATLIAKDSKTDLAVLKIEKNDCKPVILGDSDALIVGEAAVAVGNPLGELGGTVTNGIISALDREITLDGRTHNLLQTNAAISPGNSGGGLFNAKGELIGVVVAKSSGSDVEGLGFAIPVNDVKKVVEELLVNGYVSGRPALGISVVSIENYQQAITYGYNKYGVYIAEVLEDSAAEKGGLKANDYIISVDDVAVENYNDLVTILESHNIGDKITMQVQRERQLLDIDIVLEESKNQQ